MPHPPKPTGRLMISHTRVFGTISAEQAWTPAVNVYESVDALHVCVDLAGVARESIAVTAEPGRLIIEGRREVPGPEGVSTRCIRVMEIDHGLFRRAVQLPRSIDLEKVTSVYREGLLWVTLPHGR